MKRLLVFSLAMLLGCMMVFAGNPALGAGPIKIGIIYPLTGPMAVTGEMMVNSAKYAFEQVGYQIAGRKIEIVVEDSAADPAISVDKSRKMIERDKVDMVIGPVIGSEVMATASYMSKAGKPHLTSSPSPPPVFDQKWSFITCGSEPQHTTCMGIYTYDKLGYKTISVMTGDTIQGHGFLGAFMAAFKDKGGKVVQEQYAPVPCNDYAPYLANLKDADALVAWYDGSDAILFLTQVHEFAIRKRMPLVGAFHGSFFAPFILRSMSPAAADAVVGEYCVTPYTHLLDNEANKKFVADFIKKFKRPPFDTDAGPYEAALVAIEALKATGGDTSPEKLRKVILSLKIDTPGGPLRFDPATRCRVRDIYVFKVDKQEGNYIWVPVYTYKDVPPFGLGPPPGPPPRR